MRPMRLPGDVATEPGGLLIVSVFIVGMGFSE